MHETFATLRRRRHRGRYSLGAIKPDLKLDPGFLEHLRLSPRAVIGPGARFLEFFFTGPYADDATQEEEEMELLHRRCCGLDVHKETVVACLRLVSDGQVTTEVRTFGDIERNLRQAGKGYVLGVNSNHWFASWGKPQRVAGTAEEIAKTQRRSDWRRLSAGAGTKGPRLHDWCYLELADLEGELPTITARSFGHEAC